MTYKVHTSLMVISVQNSMHSTSPIITAPQLVATGTFMNPDTTRIIAKRVILTGHPFKVHKKTATIRYMFFNPGKPQLYQPESPFLHLSIRGCALFQANPTAHQTRSHWPYSRIAWYTRLLQGVLRRPHQPDGHHLYVSLQARFPEMGHDMERRTRCHSRSFRSRCYGRVK